MSDAARLQTIFQSLSHQEQQTLLYFAEFLEQNRQPSVEEEKVAKVEIPRPDEEKVIHALKRLAKSYPMLKDEAILKQGADLMTLHFVSGQPAAEVIDQLEQIFEQHYQHYLAS